MKDLEQLVQYLDGELTEAEKQQIVEKLKKDPTLGEKLDLIKDVHKLLGDKHLDSFEQSLREVEAQHTGKTTVKSRSLVSKRILWISTAAIITVMVATSAYIFFFSQSTTTTDELFAAYYEKMPADFATRSSEVIARDSFVTAVKLYNENKYSEAISEFSQIIKRDPDNTAARLFLGICYTETNDYYNAAEQFKHIISQKDPIFEEHASWYLALCYIKTRNVSSARPLLTKLVDTQSYYMGKASDLLKKLR